MSSDGRRLGLHQIAPDGSDVDNTTIDIIAIHGLGTESPRTWEFKVKETGRKINWLVDRDFLPAAVPQARIFTYDWNANYFQDAPVQTLLGHADTLLAHVAKTQDVKKQPIIFIASCFGGLILAEAINRAGQEGSPYRCVLTSTVGVVFLATPFHGTDASKQAKWQVVVGGIMGEKTSDSLIKDLEQNHDFVHQRVQKFTEIANADSVRLPLYCFFETKKTEILRRVLASRWAKFLSTGLTYKTLVTESSACLHGFHRQGLNATHSGMNKFDSPDSPDFKLVKDVINGFADKASTTLDRRQSSPHRHWMVPFGRNKEFVGRKQILQQLLERIPPIVCEDDCQRTALRGLGGVGKTQIALEAAYQIHDKHPRCSVFWVPAVNVTTFENAYREIGRLLGVTGTDEDKADVKTVVKTALSREDAGQWLLVIDNADDPELMFGSASLSNYLPFNVNGSILLTTRTHEVAVRLDIGQRGILETAKMSREESMEILQARLREDQMRDAASTNSLLDFLDYLPLAIKQASAYMARTGITTTRYLDYCRSSEATSVSLLSRDFEDRGRYDTTKNPVAATWLISFEHISRDNPRAGEYLRFMCFLTEKDIPISLLPPTDNGLEVVEAIGILESYAFITKREEGTSIDMHRLVRLAMRNWLHKEKKAQETYSRVIRRVCEIFPFPRHENRDTWIKYMPHARSALEFTEECDDEEAKSSLLNGVAEGFSELGKYKEAEEMYRQALELREKVLGKEHPDTLASMNNLALALQEQGKYKEAEEMHRQALELKEKVLGKEHPSTLASINNLALALQEQGKYKEAEEMHRQALELREKVLGKEYPDTLASMNNLALALQEQGKYKEAEEMHRQALELCEKVLGKEHPSTLTSINNLAVALEEQGKYKEAEEMHRQALELCEKVLGKEHPHTIGSRNNLASVLRSLAEETE